MSVLHHNWNTLGTLDMSGHLHKKRQRHLVETLIFIWMQKIKSILNFFLELL